MFILYILLAIFILLLMITIHEFGHYTAGKLLKFKINEFAIGFGPKIAQKKLKNGEKFTLRAIPLGGYCAFEDEAGMDGAAEREKSDAPSFVEQKPWKRLIVFASGAAFNFISAILFSLIFILVVGNATPNRRVVDVAINSVTGIEYNTQIKRNDVIVAIDGTSLSAENTMETLVGNTPVGTAVIMTIVRGGERIDIVVTKQLIESSGTSYEGFGITTTQAYKSVGFFTALAQCVPLTLELSWMILGFFGSILTGGLALTTLSGPVGTIGGIAEMAQESAFNILILLPLIAANLAIFNILPIPALDGSKIVFTSIEWARGKPIKRELENAVHLVGFALLMLLVIVVDLQNLF